MRDNTINSLKGKRILVAGGAGFIGSHTVDALLSKGARVAIIDDLSTGRKENINSKAEFYQLNIADRKTISIFQKFKPHYLYHFAYHVLVPRATENPLLEMDSIVGSVNLFLRAKEHKVKKIVFSSSGFLYGNTKNLPVKEIQPVDHVSPYIVSKHAVENYLKAIRAIGGAPYVIFRYAAIYGPRQVTGAMADYIRKLKRGRQARIWGDGGKTRDFVYIDDVVRLNLSALSLSDDYPNPIFNVGTGKETTLNELYTKIATSFNKKPQPIYLVDRAGEQYRYSLDASKAAKTFGWKPEVALAEGLSRILKQESTLFRYS